MTDPDIRGGISRASFSQEVLQCLRDWHANSPQSHPWQTLALFVSGSSLRSGINRILLAGLEGLTHSDAQAAQLLRLRFADELTAQSVANRLNVVEGTVYKWQRDAVECLAETLWRLDAEARAGKQRHLESRLPPATYTRLYGVERHLQAMTDQMISLNPPWLVAIESMGGTGKTSLADALCRKLLAQNRVVDLGWVTAQRQHLSLGGVVQSVERPALSSAELVQALAQQLLTDDPDYPTLSLQRKEERLAQRSEVSGAF